MSQSLSVKKLGPQHHSCGSHVSVYLAWHDVVSGGVKKLSKLKAMLCQFDDQFHAQSLCLISNHDRTRSVYGSTVVVAHPPRVYLLVYS